MARDHEEGPFDEEEGGPVKPFLDHLEDLRWVLIKVVSSLVIGMTICMVAVPWMIEFLKRPLPKSVKLEFLGPLSGFWVSMKLSFFGGMILALPFILYFILDFVMPALKKLERKYVLRAITVGFGLFLSGVALCYFVMLPISLRAVVQYNDWMGISTSFWRAEEYFGFVTWFMLGMGLAFEMPVVVLTLVKLGVIEHAFLVKSRRYVFVINLVVCAFITPDPLTTIFMIIPMQILLEICIVISRYWEKQKRMQEVALMASEPGHHGGAD